MSDEEKGLPELTDALANLAELPLEEQLNLLKEIQTKLSEALTTVGH